MNNLNRTFSFPLYLMSGIRYKLASNAYVPKPKFVCFPVTFQCNSRCQMCHIWKNPKTLEEISIDKIREIFINKVFNEVEEVVLHGGEPTLRRDISEICGTLDTACAKLKNITISTNGLRPDLVEERVEAILKNITKEKVRLALSVSIDGLKESHELIRGIPGAFDRAIETLKIFKTYQKNYPIDVIIITVIQPQNLEDLDELGDLAASYGARHVFQPLMIDTFYGNSPEDSRLKFSGSNLQKYKGFIWTKFGNNCTRPAVYWHNYLKMLNRGKRKIPCAFDRYVLSIYPSGDIFPCSARDWFRLGNIYSESIDSIWFSKKAKEIKKKMKRTVCPTCDFFCGADWALKKEFFTYFNFYVKHKLLSITKGSHEFRY